MTRQTEATSPLLAAVHETATDLHAAGLIDRRRLREYDALCLPPAEPGGVRGGAQHQPLDGAAVGNRRQAPERPLAQIAELAGPQGPRRVALTGR